MKEEYQAKLSWLEESLKETRAQRVLSRTEDDGALVVNPYETYLP